MVDVFLFPPDDLKNEDEESKDQKTDISNFSWVVCVQKNTLSTPSFCSEGKARSATRKAWGESKFDRVAKTLFPIDFWRNLPWSSHRLLRCLCRSASWQKCFLLICHQCNTTNHPPIHFCINTSPALSAAGLLEPEVGLHSGPKRAQTNQRAPALGLTPRNSTQEAPGWEANAQPSCSEATAPTKGPKQQHNQPKKPLSSFFGSGGFGVSAA